MSLSNRRKAARLQITPLERRDVPSGIRSYDGTGNNPDPLKFTWGSAGVNLLRVAGNTYDGGISTPSSGRPNPRAISNAIVDQGSEDVLSERGLAAMAYTWGQFIDHDMSHTLSAKPSEPFGISVPSGDSHFSPNSSIALRRSAFGVGTGVTTPRQQVNSLSAFLDGSQIYGSDITTAHKLRTLSGGRLKTSVGGMLPYNNVATFPTGTLPMDNNTHIVPDAKLFAAGDVRANENIELTALHTLFVREHNRVARTIQNDNPRLSDEAIYQRARAWVIAELEAITYNEWLPTLLGPAGLAPYQGYKPNVNPGIANEFSTAGFRLGHSMLGDDVEFLNNFGLPIADEVPLSEAFFNPPMLVINGGIDPVLKYLVTDPASEIDSTVVNSVRNFLFGPPGAGGMDLASLNIQRGRDHGLADYNTARVAYGLPAVSSFAQMTSNVELQQKLRSVYGTTAGGADNVGKVDLWVGMLAEDHIPGASTGRLVARILVDQFTRLRDGDSFWYERTFTGPALQQLRNTTLTDVLRRNTNLNLLQSNVFTFKASISGVVFNDLNHNGRRNQNEPAIRGRTIELIDASSKAVIATTVTAANGSYSFDVLDGLGAGRFRVREVLPSGMMNTSPPSPVWAVTRGDCHFCQDIGNASKTLPRLTGCYGTWVSDNNSTGATGTSPNPYYEFQSQYMAESI